MELELDKNPWRKSVEKEGGGLQTEPWEPLCLISGCHNTIVWVT